MWILCLAAPGVSAGGLAGPVEAEVVRVVDGDTIEVRARVWLDQEIMAQVRIAHVDAPETYRPACPQERAAGEAAKAFLTERLAGATVRLKNIQHGKYAGRIVADVEDGTGADMASLLTANGKAAAAETRQDYCDIL